MGKAQAMETAEWRAETTKDENGNAINKTETVGTTRKREGAIKTFPSLPLDCEGTQEQRMSPQTPCFLHKKTTRRK